MDGSDSNTAAIAMGYAEAMVANLRRRSKSGAQIRRGGNMKRPSTRECACWYNTDLVSRNYIVPGLIAVTMMIIAALLTSLTIAREWENGTMEQLLSTPLRPAEIVLGKLLAFFTVGITDLAICIVVAVFLSACRCEVPSGFWCCRAVFFCSERWCGAF